VQRAVQKNQPPRSTISKQKTDAGQHRKTDSVRLTSVKNGDHQSATAPAGAAATGGSGDAVTSVSPDYYHRLAAWLEQHKRYPRRAVQRRQQGVVRVSFKIDREGNLLAREIVASSGYRLLDEAADSLLLRASPMPGIPHQSTAQVLEVIVPIKFALN
jgi:protein TonB